VKRFYLYLLTGLSTVMAVSSAVMMYTGDNLSAALSAVGSILFIEYGVEKSISLKNRNYIKAFNKTSLLLVEIVLLSGLLISQDLPAVITVATLSSLTLFQCLKRNSENYLNKDLDVRFGRRGRSIIIVSALLLSVLNTYYILLGAYLLIGILVSDSGEILYGLYSNQRNSRESSKLKERILSR